MSEFNNRGAIPVAAGETVLFERSPFVQGFLAGVKGALVGAPAGSLVQYMRGGNPVVGAIVGGLGAGLLGGLAKGVTQDLENVGHEESMRYYVNRLKEREPLLYMPPPSVFGKIFNRFHAQGHALIPKGGT